MIGRIVADRYRILEEIGKGGMGRVYRAEQLGLDRIVALKILHPAIGASPEERSRLLQEAKICARLSHPNIVEVYDVGEWNDQAYIAMECIRGVELHRLMKQGIERRRGLLLLAEVCRALQCAHDAGVVHRDLKPENVLVEEGGRARVVDWGLAKSHEASRRLTRTGVIMGTPTYMAPEQIRSMPLTGACDLYALGVMLYELLDGTPPFENEAIARVLLAHLNDPVPSLRPIEPAVSEGLIALVDRLLQKDPEQRPSSAAHVAEALEELADDVESGEGRPRLSGSSSRMTRGSLRPERRTLRGHATSALAEPPSKVSRRGLLFGGLGVLVFLLGAVALRFLGGAPSESGGKAFALRTASIDEEGRLLIRFAGIPPDPLRWELEEDDAPPAFARRGGLLRYDESTPVSQVTRHWILALDPVVLHGARLRFPDLELAPMALSPNAHLLRSLEFLRQLSSPKFEALVERVILLRSRLRPHELAPKLKLVFDEAGFRGPSFEALRRFLAGIRPGQLYLKDGLARTFLPLMRLEGHLSEAVGLAAPWPPSFRCFALKSRYFDSVDRLKPWFGTRLVEYQEGERGLPNPHRRRLLWLHTAEQVWRFRRDPEKFLRVANTMSFASDQAPATEGDWFQEGRFLLSVPPSLLGKGEQGLDVILAVSWQLQRICIELQINGSAPYRVMNVAPYEAPSGTGLRESRWLYQFSAGRQDLRPGENEFRLRVRWLSGALPAHGTAIGGIGLVRVP